MQEFPTMVQLLDGLMSRKPHTRDGQWRVAEYLHELSRKHALGTSNILSYTSGVNGHAETFPIFTLDLEPNIQSSATREECIALFGHFDTVNPSYYQKHNVGRDPFRLTLDPHNPDIGFGHGSGDMLGGIAASMKTFRKLTKRNGDSRPALPRHMRFVAVTNEEDKSQGTYAAMEQGVFEGVTGLVTNEILVGGTLEGPNPVYNARLGRVGLDLTVNGVNSHSGGAAKRIDLIDHLAVVRFSKVILELMKMRFPRVPMSGLHAEDEDRSTNGNGICDVLVPAPGNFGSRKHSMLSVAGSGDVHLDIFHGDPGLSVPEIVRRVHEVVEKALGDQNFLLQTERRESNREFIGPWHTPTTEPLVEIASEHAKRLTGKGMTPVQAEGVADEGIVLNTLDIPGIGWSPQMHGEHTVEECVSMKSLKENAGWQAAIATDERSLR